MAAPIGFDLGKTNLHVSPNLRYYRAIFFGRIAQQDFEDLLLVD
jgi:hypothetical protein